MIERPRAAIYVRISQDRTGAGLGVDRQVADCRALAERLGHDVCIVHTDNDISAYSGKPRPGYRALLDDIAAGRIDVVLVWHSDRLHRSPVELEGYITACQPRGVGTHSVQAGHLDLSTPSGRMVARQLGAVARFESEHKGERVRAARQQRAQSGGWGGGARPFGFEADGVTVRPSEAAEIIAATDSLLAGAGLRGIVRDLNARGVRTTFRAQEWSPRSFKDVLLRARNAGLATYRGEVIGPASWPAIVPEDRWRALVALLTDPARRTSPAELRVRWLGSGLYVCGVCEQPRLRANTTPGRAPFYRCTARETLPQQTGHVSRNAPALDGYIGDVVVERLSRPDAAELLRDRGEGVDTRPLHAEATELRERLTQLSGAFADGDITLAQLRTGTDRMRTRLAEIEAGLAAALTVDPLAALAGEPDAGAAWRAMDVTRQRAVVDALMTVTVLPGTRRWGPDGKRFDPAGVRVDWKR